MGTRELGGALAKAAGATFESLFLLSCKKTGIVATRIPDACRQISQYKIIRTKAPFDFILSWKGVSSFIDTKSTLKSTFAHSKIDSDQVRNLALHESQGAYAGYVINLHAKDRVFFISAQVLSRLQHERGSICELYPGAKVLGTSLNFDPRIIFL